MPARRAPQPAPPGTGMRTGIWTDAEGRRWTTRIPAGAPDEEFAMGIPVGPPSLAALGMPLDIEVGIHNELHDRGIFTLRDAKTRSAEIIAAWQTIVRGDVRRIMDIYALEERGPG